MSPPGFHLVLLAGGRGTRFWPASRAARPKQFLSLGGPSSFLRQTFDRFERNSHAAGACEVVVVAPREYHDLVRQELPALTPGGIIEEPSARDTAAAVGLACLGVRRRDPKGLIVVSPTDHHVADTGSFHAALDRALARAAEGGLGTLGVRPDRAATEFGYLETAGWAEGAIPVLRFVEKPSPVAAAGFLAGGKHLWNAGIFVFRVDVFFEEAARVAPDFAAGLEEFDRERLTGNDPAARAAWESIPKLSLDYALMEKAGGVWTVPLDAGWDDLGGWEAVARRLPRDAEGNAAAAEKAMFVGSRDCTLVADPGASRPGLPLTVMVGVEDLIVVQAGDVTLICRSGRAAEVKQVIERLKSAGRTDLL